jgi:molecular chaperone HtpG
MSEETKNENFTFQAEVQQLLNLVIHSLYSEREVFLRELISNASDACGRLRFDSLTNPEMRESEQDSSIDIEVNKRAKTIKIHDNGIGMSRDEVVENIGTIARSGTKRFVEALSGEQSEDTRLIGQFGVGFYSVFMVAENVVIRTRRAGQPPQSGVLWESDGVSGYTVNQETIENPGTEIILTLRKEAKDFLDISEVRRIVRKYSDHVSIPIRLREVTKSKEEDEWETANAGSALWTRARKDVTEEEYDNFYSTLSFDPGKPLVRLHNRVEGRLEYSALLYIPSQAPFDLFDIDRQKGIKLYVRRIFIMDDTDNLLPGYLRFVRGVIDSDDLPLNVSREFLQKNKQVERIRAGTVRKLLNELKRVASKDAEKYQTFWKEFGRVFKEGITEDSDNRKTIAQLLRFTSTKGEGAEQTVSLQDYVDRMKEKQDAVYYVTADSHASAEGSPHLEIFRKHDIEVLLMSDPIDEWVVMHLGDFDDKPLKSIAKGDLALEWLDDDDKSDEKDTLKVDSLVDRLKEALTERAADVRTTSRLTDSPACLVVNEYSLSRNMSRILKVSGQSSADMPPILEINPEHPLIRHLADKDDNLNDWAHVLFDQATLSEGTPLENPSDYVRRINSLLTNSITEKSPIIIAS